MCRPIRCAGRGRAGGEGISLAPSPVDADRPATYGLVVPHLLPIPIFLMAVALLLPGAAFADDSAIGPGDSRVEEPSNQTRVYVYVDAEGQLHFVDRLELVPARYRSTVRETSLVSTTDDHDEAAQRAAKKRRDVRAQQAAEARRQEAAARLQARDAAAARAAEDPDATDERPPSRAEKLADALTERRAVLEELVALEEGYAEDVEQSEDALIARIDALDKRLGELDRAIAKLKKTD